MSDHKCEIIPVVLEKHPNADNLSVVKVFDGYQVVVRTEDWVGVDRGVYIPPDSIVPNTEQFKFLEGHLRIKAKRLRGIESFGLLVPIPPLIFNCGDFTPYQIGDDLAEVMGIEHYEPEMSSILKAAQGEFGDPPPISGPVYDVENWRKYKNEFVDGEEVVITEKIHGTNSRFTFQLSKEGVEMRMFCGSHKTWKKKCSDGLGGIKQNIYWSILESHPWVEAFCRLNPGVILYGEIFGAILKGFNYESTQDNPYQFRAFDVYANGRFLDYDDALGGAKSDFLVPVLYRGPYSPEVVLKYSTGNTTLGGKHIREGVVIKPVKERYSDRLHGRVILKCVSMDYLEDKKKK